MTSDKEIILRMTEKRSASIYTQFWIPHHRERQIQDMLEDPKVELSQQAGIEYEAKYLW